MATNESDFQEKMHFDGWEYFWKYYTVPKIVISTSFAWTTTYFLITKLKDPEPERAVRKLTVVHAVIVTILSVLNWSYFRKWDVEKLGEPNSKYEEVVLCLTLGYFLFDIVWISTYQTEGCAMYFHHIASIASLVVILKQGTSASEVLVGISGLELTNPCLQARWFLRAHGHQNTTLYTIVEILFMATFIIFRIFYGSYLSYHVLRHPKCHFALKIGTICLYVVSWAFVCQMIAYVNKRYRKSKNLKKE